MFLCIPTKASLVRQSYTIVNITTIVQCYSDETDGSVIHLADGSCITTTLDLGELLNDLEACQEAPMSPIQFEMET